MKRRRGEVSLFEILRQPEPPTVVDEADEAEAVPGSDRSRGGVDPAVGSTTPIPDPEPRPRLDVTPPARTSRRLPEIATELTSTAHPETSGHTEMAGSPWWERPLTFRPIMVGLAMLGVAISWVIIFQLGVGSAEREQARRDLFTVEDNPGWDVPIIHDPPSQQPEVRNIQDANGNPAAPMPQTLPGGNQLLHVLMVAQRLRTPENAEALMLHIEEHSEKGCAHVTIFNNDYAVFIGPFDSLEEAKEGQKKARRIPSSLGVQFQSAYIHELEFTPEHLRLLGRG